MSPAFAGNPRVTLIFTFFGCPSRAATHLFPGSDPGQYGDDVNDDDNVADNDDVDDEDDDDDDDDVNDDDFNDDDNVDDHDRSPGWPGSLLFSRHTQ